MKAYPLTLTIAFALLASLAGLSGCSTDEDTPGGVSPDLSAVYQKFESNLTVYEDGDYIVVESDGVPTHPSPYFDASDSRYETYNGDNPAFNLNPNRISEQNLVFRIPKNPTEATTKAATPMGPIGVALNGIPFFNQYAAGGAALTQEINSFDQYNGHPQMSGQYHYHVEPYFLTNTYGEDALLGFLLDGFPVYGPMENGTYVDESELDAYHGHTTATADFPDGIYHYHVTDQDPYINGNGFYGVAGTVTQ